MMKHRKVELICPVSRFAFAALVLLAPLAVAAQLPTLGLRSEFRGLTRHPAPSTKQQVDEASVTRQSLLQPSGNKTVEGCPSEAHLRSLVDDYLATPHPDFPGVGSSIPGLSVSLSSPECGTFTYAAGLRNIEENKPMTPASRMGIASMSKPIIAALALILNERGVFGPDGLDTTVDRLLTPEQIRALTVGDDPLQPQCPGSTFLLNRETLQYEWTSFSCPDLSRVTLRDLMRANHGMYDILNEILQPSGFSVYSDGLHFNFWQSIGLNPTPPANSTNGYDYLRAIGLKQHDGASVGGTDLHDFEVSLGNTGFQLLGVILEHKTGGSLDQLIQRLIVEPLRIDPIVVYVDARQHRNQIVDGYEIYGLDPYPFVVFNGFAATNTLSLGLGHPGNVNLAGGAGGLIANPRSYQVFLDALVNGGLLGPGAQNELENSYVAIPGLSIPDQAFFNGFGLWKAEVRGFPGFPDVDFFQHNGSLPGILCFNGALRSPGSTRKLATTVMCQNNRVLAFPELFQLNLDVLRILVEAQDSQIAESSARQHVKRKPDDSAITLLRRGELNGRTIVADGQAAIL